MSFNYSPKIVTDGLVLYLDAANTKSYVSGSTIWNDISRGGNTGTLINGPTFNSSNNGVITFDGINDYVTTNYSDSTSTLTMEYVVSFNSVAATYVVGGRIGSGDYWSGLYNGEITFSMNGSVMSTNFIASLNTFYHVTCVFTSTNRLIYINGVLIKSELLSGSTIPGGNLEISVFNNSFFAPIKLGLFKFYNRNLSSSEVLQNYNTTKSRFGLI